MTQKEIDLLLQDLSSRLRYGVQLCVPGYTVPYKLLGMDGDVLHIDTPVYGEGDGFFELDCFNIKPYLRPLSSMTEKEKREYYVFCTKPYLGIDEETASNFIDWLNRKMFDYRGLIPMGLALKAPEGMYEKEFEITFKEDKKKTFRRLEHGDRVLLKGVVFNNDCDVTIDGHNYTRERICKDVEVKVTSNPSYESVFGGDELYFWAEYGESKEPIRCVFGKADLDKTESGNMVIIQEEENGEA